MRHTIIKSIGRDTSNSSNAQWAIKKIYGGLDEDCSVLRLLSDFMPSIWTPTQTLHTFMEVACMGKYRLRVQFFFCIHRVQCWWGVLRLKVFSLSRFMEWNWMSLLYFLHFLLLLNKQYSCYKQLSLVLINITDQLLLQNS